MKPQFVKATIRVRRDFQGNVLEREVLETTTVGAEAMFKELAAIYAAKFRNDPDFQRYCEEQRREVRA
jgi:hypothetical protein